MYLRAYAQTVRWRGGTAGDSTSDNAAFKMGVTLTAPLFAAGVIAWIYLHKYFPITFTRYPEFTSYDCVVADFCCERILDLPASL
jgi:hypothetical protein